MYRKKIIFYIVCLILVMMSFACASSTPPAPTTVDDSAARSRVAGRNAANRLDGGNTATTPTPTRNDEIKAPTDNTPASQTIVTTSTTRPSWVDNPASKYGNLRYVFGVGNGMNRDMAEKNALANLSAFFGQSIQADNSNTYRYDEAIRSGALADYLETSTIKNTVTTQSSLDELIGAEIKEVWQNGSSDFYALAVMDKEITTQIYSDKIIANKSIIDNLININSSDINTLTHYSRYQYAAIVADVNMKYADLLRSIGAEPPIAVVAGSKYRLDQQNIAKNISMGVRVQNDKANRINNALTKAITDLGFRNGGGNARYLFDTNINISSVDNPNNNFKFVRIVVDLNLRDTATDTVITTYSFNDRQGHATESEAENRAIAAAEKKINVEFKDFFIEVLGQLLPKK